MDENTRILQCREKIIRALNEAQIPLAVSALILEAVQLQVQHELAKEDARRTAAEKEAKNDGKPDKA